ncbi:hypothetical protein M6D93_17420 [Jatrophihabitans telluris]|uniref:Uncharacterized protein n=1 Tax=Jatrophihabitans telluris TaxID=2038343 RepID=A0ABY4QWR6_9ACTN|nr:hypothetical protein [Jatrophihabitans telluris]UQX88054.1 hypothetical protein M6D93_17420 [Jatrophihabitans telluris]
MLATAARRRAAVGAFGILVAGGLMLGAQPASASAAHVTCHGSHGKSATETSAYSYSGTESGSSKYGSSKYGSSKYGSSESGSSKDRKKSKHGPRDGRGRSTSHGEDSEASVVSYATSTASSDGKSLHSRHTAKPVQGVTAAVTGVGTVVKTLVTNEHSNGSSASSSSHSSSSASAGSSSTSTSTSSSSSSGSSGAGKAGTPKSATTPGTKPSSGKQPAKAPAKAATKTATNKPVLITTAAVKTTDSGTAHAASPSLADQVAGNQRQAAATTRPGPSSSAPPAVTAKPRTAFVAEPQILQIAAASPLGATGALLGTGVLFLGLALIVAGTRRGRTRASA